LVVINSRLGLRHHVNNSAIWQGAASQNGFVPGPLASRGFCDIDLLNLHRFDGLLEILISHDVTHRIANSKNVPFINFDADYSRLVLEVRHGTDTSIVGGNLSNSSLAVENRSDGFWRPVPSLLGSK